VLRVTFDASGSGDVAETVDAVRINVIASYALITGIIGNVKAG
jgi:hypothetical protein